MRRLLVCVFMVFAVLSCFVDVAVAGEARRLIDGPFEVEVLSTETASTFPST